MYKIGNVKLENNLMLAPLHGVSCNAFRLICKKHGAGLVYTSMIHDETLIRRKWACDVVDEEGPIAIQLVGKNPEKMSEAAKIVEEKADIIDINLGCPDQDVLANQAGAFLIKHPEQMVKMVSKVVSSVSKPVTAKIRIGWDTKSINAVEVSKMLEDCGVAAIAVHGRTRKQMYTGKANWDVIKQVKEIVNVPVIGNGDIFEAEDYIRMIEKTKVDFVMIGRGAMGNPHLFENCLRLVEGKELIEKDLKLAYDMFSEFVNYYDKYSTRNIFSEIRQHAMWFAKGVKNGAVLKNQLIKIQDINELKKVFENFE